MATMRIIDNGARFAVPGQDATQRFPYGQMGNVIQGQQSYVANAHPVVLPTHGTDSDFVTTHVPIQNSAVYSGVSPEQAHFGEIRSSNPNWGVVFVPRQNRDYSAIDNAVAMSLANAPMPTMADIMKLMAMRARPQVRRTGGGGGVGSTVRTGQNSGNSPAGSSTGSPNVEKKTPPPASPTASLPLQFVQMTGVNGQNSVGFQRPFINQSSVLDDGTVSVTNWNNQLVYDPNTGTTRNITATDNPKGTLSYLQTLTPGDPNSVTNYSVGDEVATGNYIPLSTSASGTVLATGLKDVSGNTTGAPRTEQTTTNTEMSYPLAVANLFYPWVRKLPYPSHPLNEKGVQLAKDIGTLLYPGVDYRGLYPRGQQGYSIPSTLQTKTVEPVLSATPATGTSSISVGAGLSDDDKTQIDTWFNKFSPLQQINVLKQMKDDPSKQELYLYLAGKFTGNI